MREIKFRAWHKKYKKIYEISDLHMANLMNGGIWATANGRNPIEDKDIKIQIQPNEIIVMEFTGLNDTNGKEIYECDICTIWMGVKQDNPYVVEDLRELYLDMNHADSYYRITKIEIVGNIYENPELLIK